VPQGTEWQPYSAEAAKVRIIALAAMLAVVPCWGADDGAWQVPVAVFDFNNLCTYRGHMLGRRAADALHVALADAQRWRLVPRRDIRLQCRKLSLKPPFAVGYLQQVAHLVGAHLAISGTVTDCRLDAEGWAVVALSTEMIDIVSGEAAASFAVTGRARHRAGQPADITVDHALAQAGAQAAEKLLDFAALYISVQGRSGRDVVFLKSDANGRLVPGLRLLVYRTGADGHPVGEPVALIRVENVGPRHAECRVVAATDIITVKDVAVAVGR